MATIKKKNYLIDNEEAAVLEKALRDMETSGLYNTEASYSANSDKYPNNVIPFVDKHMNYMRQNQALSPQEYLSNLRLMTRIR